MKFFFLDDILTEYIPAEKLSEVKRLLYGYNAGKLVEEVPIPSQVQEMAKKFNFDVKYEIYQIFSFLSLILLPETFDLRLHLNNLELLEL